MTWQSATSPFSDVAQCHTSENTDVWLCHTLLNCWVGPSWPAVPHLPPPFFFLPFFSSPHSFLLSRASSVPLPCNSLLPCCSGDAADPVTSSLPPATPQAISSFKLHIYYIYNCTYWSIFNIFRILF